MPLLLESIGKKMDEIRSPYRLVIVDDGSTDGTEDLLKVYQDRYPITVLKHDTNKNVGQVFRTGFKYVLDQAKKGDIIVTKEADNTGDLGILPAMLKKASEGDDVVLASCYAKGGGIEGTTLDRIILSSVANMLLRIFFPIKGVSTYSSFYRAYKADVIKKAFAAYGSRFMEEDGFACMVEMLVKLSRLPIRIAEVPMVLRCDLRRGKSKMDKSETMLAYFRLISREIVGGKKDIGAVLARFGGLS